MKALPICLLVCLVYECDPSCIYFSCSHALDVQEKQLSSTQPNPQLHQTSKSL